MPEGITASLITPPGFGGIAVIRLAGNSLNSIISAVFSSVSGISSNDFKLNKYYLGDIRDCDEVIDQVMLVIKSSGSLAEIHSHGGPRVIQRILLLLSGLGINIVDYHLHYDLLSIRQEVDYYLCQLKTELSVSAIAAQYPGGLFNWLNQMLDLLKSNEPLELFKQSVADVLVTFQTGHRLLNPSKVVLAGPPNAGKSTLANFLTGRQQSLVSQIPGTTRDWTSELTDIDGLAVELIDTAGLRESDDILENYGIKSGMVAYKEADLIVLLIPAESVSGIEQLLADYRNILPKSIKILTVVSKADILDGSLTEGLISISTNTEQGINQLKQEIRRNLGIRDDFDYKSPLIFTARQYQLIKDSLAGSRKEAESLLSVCIAGQ